MSRYREQNRARSLTVEQWISSLPIGDYEVGCRGATRRALPQPFALLDSAIPRLGILCPSGDQECDCRHVRSRHRVLSSLLEGPCWVGQDAEGPNDRAVVARMGHQQKGGSG